jgi:hypothetical protein
VLTFSKAVEDGGRSHDDGEGAQDQRNDELDVRVGGRLLGYEPVDVKGRHRRAGVRLLGRYFVLCDRGTGVVVRPYAHLVARARLQFAQCIRFLHLGQVLIRYYPL